MVVEAKPYCQGKPHNLSALYHFLAPVTAHPKSGRALFACKAPDDSSVPADSDAVDQLGISRRWCERLRQDEGLWFALAGMSCKRLPLGQ